MGTRAWARPAAGVVAALRAQPLLWLLVGGAVAAYTTYSLIRHNHFASGGFDLGIFDQTIWHYSRFEAPASSIKDVASILGDHFSPALALLAPLYWLWDDVRMLLITQALLVALAAVPIFVFCRARVGRAGALMLVASYLVFWGVQSAIGFDFHEVALAPPLIAGALVAIDRGRLGVALALCAGLLLVKEDLSFLVAAFGVYLLTLGHRRAGMACLLGGVAWYGLVSAVVIPHFAGGRSFAYWSYQQFGSSLPDAVAGVITHPWRLLTVGLGDSTKIATLARLVVPFLGLALLSRVAILAVPLLAERFLSDTPSYWTTGSHYSLTIAVVLVCGSAAGLQTLGRWRRLERWRTPGIAVACAAVLALNIVSARGFPLTSLLHPSFYRAGANTPALRAALALVPPGASVATEDALVAHLSHRQTVAEISPQTGETDYVVVNYAGPFGAMTPNGGFAAVHAWLAAHQKDYRVLYLNGGWAVLQRT